MLWDASSINGFSLRALDGVFGAVSDLLFDKDRWLLSRLVVDTGVWPLTGNVDLPVGAVGRPDFKTRSFKANKTVGDLESTYSSDNPPTGESESQLMSVSALVGYNVVAIDGNIGHVENVLIDEEDLTIRFVTIHTADWWPGVKVLVAPASIARIDTNERCVVLDIGIEKVRAAPVFDATATLDGVEDARFLTYFGIRWVES